MSARRDAPTHHSFHPALVFGPRMPVVTVLIQSTNKTNNGHKATHKTTAKKFPGPVFFAYFVTGNNTMPARRSNTVAVKSLQKKKEENDKHDIGDETCPHCNRAIASLAWHIHCCPELQKQKQEKREEAKRHQEEQARKKAQEEENKVAIEDDADSACDPGYLFPNEDDEEGTTAIFSVNSKKEKSVYPLVPRSTRGRPKVQSEEDLLSHCSEGHTTNDIVVHGDHAAHLLLNDDQVSLEFVDIVKPGDEREVDMNPDPIDDLFQKPGLQINVDIAHDPGIDDEEISLPEMELDATFLEGANPVPIAQVITERQQEADNLGIASRTDTTEAIARLLETNPCLGHTLNRPAADYGDPDIHDNTTLAMLEIIDFCDSMSHSREFVDGLMEILEKVMERYNFHPSLAKKRATYAELVRRKYGTDNQPEVGRFRVASDNDPYGTTENGEVEDEDIAETEGNKVAVVTSRERDTLNCVAFQFEKQFLDLINDIEIFGNANNLVVNKTGNPFLPYRHIGHSDDMNDGSWYKQTIQRLSDSEEGFDSRYESLAGIILYADKTGITKDQRYPLEPVLFSTSLIRRELRNYPRAWRPLGFMPDLESKSSSETTVNRAKDPSTMPKSYHRFLSYILKSLHDLQKTGLVTWLRIGDQVSYRRIRFEIQCVIGDGKSADMMTTRYGGHRVGCARISRSCLTPQHGCDNVLETCQYIEAHQPRTAFMRRLDGEPMEGLKPEHLPSGVPPGSIKRDFSLIDLMEITSMPPTSIVEVYQPLLSYNTPTMVEERTRLASQADGRRSKTKTTKKRKPTERQLQKQREEAEKERERLEAMEEKIVRERLALAETIKKQAFSYLKGALGLHPVENAFLPFNFGYDPRHLWGAFPTDLMHAYQSGLLMYINRMLLDKLPNKKRMMLDRLVDRILGRKRTSTKKMWPRYNFTKGFCKLSFITSDEWVGKLFVLLIVASTEEGKSIMQCRFSDREEIPLASKEDFKGLERLRGKNDIEIEAHYYYEQAIDLESKTPAKRRGKQKDEDLVETDHKRDEEYTAREKSCGYTDFIHLAEAMLCFHAWYKRCIMSTYSKRRIEAGVRRLLAMVKCYLPRGRGMHWCIQKFHELLHLAEEIDRFGNPRNYDAGPLESSLKFWAKFFSITAQKRGYNSFVHQVALRIHEQQCFFKARRRNKVSGCNDGKLPQMNADGGFSSEKEPKLGGGPELKGSCYRVYRTKVKVNQQSKRGKVHDQANETGVTQAVPAAPDATKRYKLSEQAGSDKKRKAYSELHPMIETELRRIQSNSVPVHAVPQEDKTNDGFVDVPSPYCTGEGDDKLEFWDLYTECELVYIDKRKNLAEGRDTDGERSTLRAHPNFQNEGPFYDWVMVKFDQDETQQEELQQSRARHNIDPQHEVNCCPCKLLGFVKDAATGQVMAMVHPCDWQTEQEVKDGSVLLEHWTLSFRHDESRVFYRNRQDEQKKRNPMSHVYNPNLTFVSIDSIKCSCFVVEATPGMKQNVWVGKEETDPSRKRGGRYSLKYDPDDKLRRATSCILVRSREQWGKKFI